MMQGSVRAHSPGMWLPIWYGDTNKNLKNSVRGLWYGSYAESEGEETGFLSWAWLKTRVKPLP